MTKIRTKLILLLYRFLYVAIVIITNIILVIIIIYRIDNSLRSLKKEDMFYVVVVFCKIVYIY